MRKKFFSFVDVGVCVPDVSPLCFFVKEREEKFLRSVAIFHFEPPCECARYSSKPERTFEAGESPATSRLAGGRAAEGTAILLPPFQILVQQANEGSSELPPIDEIVLSKFRCGRLR
jgi:hypothetical protein